jgi:hypothetical protein
LRQKGTQSEKYQYGHRAFRPMLVITACLDATDRIRTA